MAGRTPHRPQRSAPGQPSTGRGTCPARSWLPLLVLPFIGLGWGNHAAQARNQPPGPASRPTVYDPAPTTCQADNIRKAFARQLEPFADQPETVLQHLRKVQLQLTVASLQRCVAKGLMDEATARALAAELLGDQVPGTSIRP